MQHFLFCEKDVSADRWSKGHPCHHAHSVLRGDAKQIWWLPSTLSTPSENKRENSSSGGRIRAWVGLAHMMNNLACNLTHNVRPQTEMADLSTLESRESSKFKFCLFPCWCGRRMGADWLLFWSVSATLTVMKSLTPCPHSLRRCLDKHTIHTEQMSHLLDMHRSSNHYLASS